MKILEKLDSRPVAIGLALATGIKSGIKYGPEFGILVGLLAGLVFIPCAIIVHKVFAKLSNQKNSG